MDDDPELRRRERLHVLEAIALAIERRDQLMDITGRSASADAARVALQRAFGFDEIQATAALDLQVRRFASVERSRILDERDELRRTVEGSPDAASVRFARAVERAEQVARGLAGLSDAAAREQALQHPDLQFEFVPEGGTVSLDLRSNRIRLRMRDGVVVSASAG